MYVDAHCHLDDSAFDGDRDLVFGRARAGGVTGFLLAGVDPTTWARQREVSRHEPGVRFTAGLHPCVAARGTLAANDAVIATLASQFAGAWPASGLGETGLDSRFCDRSTLPVQEAAFRAQLDLARALDVPVVLHLNGPGTHGRALALLRGDGLPAAGGMVHAYSGSAELVADYVALGLFVSFAGTVGRPEARRVHAAVRATPAERLLVETDAPDLALPGAPRRNEPVALLAVALAVGAIRDESAETVLTRSASACERLFGPFTLPRLLVDADLVPGEMCRHVRE